jgi:hypothetical protein
MLEPTDHRAGLVSMDGVTNRKTLFATAAVLAVVAGGVALINIDRIAVWLAPQKQATESRSEAAEKADKLFWQTFHQGEYEKIPQALAVLTAAYLETPTDAVTAAHIAWLHNWRTAERARSDSVSATITDDTHLARRYFQEAVALNPADPRTQGFLAGHTVIEGTLHQDDKLTREGYFMLLDAIEAWPEFNLFTAGYVMSRLPADSPRFQEGLEWQWRTLDECTDGKLDRTNPDYSRYMSMETRAGRKRGLLELLDRATQLRRLFSEHGRHAGQSRRLANRAKGLCQREACQGLRELAVPDRARGAHPASASQRGAVQCA